jgi:predicted GIY-YIG superfamily endonuclease
MSGIVYMVSSPNTDKVYIGSTVQALTRRFTDHKSKFKNNHKNQTKAAIVIAAGDAKITELFKFETCTIKELRLKEAEYINQYKDNLVNLLDTKGYTGLTSKEICFKRYHEQLSVCCMYCEREYKQRHMEKHVKSMKHNIKKIDVLRYELGPDFENIKVNGKNCSIA